MFKRQHTLFYTGIEEDFWLFCGVELDSVFVLLKKYNSVVFHTDCLIKVFLIIQIYFSAKQLVRGEPNVSYICSRYYRAPELIFGATDYTSNIDVWSAGCVLAELLLGQPIFPGDSGVDQLVEIIKVILTPYF